jgi:hypothetical protein
MITLTGLDVASPLPLALTAGLVTAAIEYPISQYYATVPATSTGKRMLIAGAMAGGAALIASLILRKIYP